MGEVNIIVSQYDPDKILIGEGNEWRVRACTQQEKMSKCPLLKMVWVLVNWFLFPNREKFS